jgi:hypothetical protein
MTPLGRTSGQPCHRSIIALDVEGSTTRTNTARGWLRQDMYGLFKAALRTAGVTADKHDQLVDRGDGVLALIHPVDEAPKTLLLTTVVPQLREMLEEHNARTPHRCLRLRVVVHAGEVHHDHQGCFGEDIDLAVRLLDAPEVRQHLGHSITPLVLVVSDLIYQSVVRHGYDGIDDLDFTTPVDIQIAGRLHRGRLLAERSPAVNPVERRELQVQT